MAFNKADYRDTIERLTATWSGAWKAWGDRVANEIEFLLAAGEPVEDAITAAMNGVPDNIAAATRAAVVNAAAAGFGIKPAEIGVEQKAAIVNKLNTTPWAPDRMILSDRLHRLPPIMKDVISHTITQQMKAGTNWIDLSRQLYEGYGYGSKIRKADLPPYLDKIQQAARHNLTPEDFAAFRKDLAAARRMVDRLGANDAPNVALKAAYQKLLKAAETGSDKALKTAIDVAVNEKARYHAERIARTEIARAWADGFFTQNQNDPDVIAYRWRLSSRHLTPDICDVHAKADLFGLGPGTYPKDRVPPQPSHPHCTCHFEQVFQGELDGLTPIYRPDFLEARGRMFFRSLDPDVARKIIGEDGMKAVSLGQDWRPHLPGWQGHENPAARLKPADFVKSTPPAIPTPPPAPKPKPVPQPAPQPKQAPQPVKNDILKAEPYKPVNNVKKATEWAKNNLPIDFVEFKGYAPELADKANALFQKLYQRYPEMIGRTKFLGTGQERNRQYLDRVVQESIDAYIAAHTGKQLPFTIDQYRQAAKKRLKPKNIPANVFAQSSNKSWKAQEGIAFNENWSKDISKLTTATERCVNSGFHPLGTDDPVSIVTHEFGHQIDNLIIENNLRKELDNLWDQWSKENLNHRKNGYHTFRQDTLSEYASKTSAEFIAEGFAEYIHNPTPRPWAQKIGQAIENAFVQIRAKGGQP